MLRSRTSVVIANYLERRGITDLKRINQIANFAMVEWSDNIKISDLPPGEYWRGELTASAHRPGELGSQWCTAGRTEPPLAMNGIAVAAGQQLGTVDGDETTETFPCRQHSRRSRAPTRSLSR